MIRVSRGRNGKGVKLYNEHASRYEQQIGTSYMDAARLLFDLKDFLRASDTGRRCVDEVAAKRRAER